MADYKYYQLIAGDHIGNDEEGKERYYRQGDPVPSVVDLEQRWPEKFRRMDGAVLQAAREGFGPGHKAQRQHQAKETPSASDLAVFDTMTVEELKQYAVEEEIDLGKATRKEDMVKVIKRSLTEG